MKKLLVLIALWVAGAHDSRAQVLRQEYLAYDFDTAGFGFDSPRQLGNAFFAELQGGQDLHRFFSTMEVFNYMIVISDMKHAKTALAATEHYWKEFEEQRNQYCNQLLDNIKSRNMNMQQAELLAINYKEEQVNDSDVLATDIELIFGYQEDSYSILLDDCGRIKGKWFLMTPYVLWQGKVKDRQAEQTK